jgi:uncharacterized membrane protein YedE/YeeE
LRKTEHSFLYRHMEKGSALMLFELIETDLSARSLQIWAGLALGLLFGGAAQTSRFCLRRAVADKDLGAAAVWLCALSVAVIGFATAQAWGLVTLEGHRFSGKELPVFALTFGGLAFGAGMVLTRGCAARLTVLSATGNLRALLVLIVFALTAHATMKGVLAPLPATLSQFTLQSPIGSLSEISGGVTFCALLLLGAVLVLAYHGKARARDLLLGSSIGMIVVASWGVSSVLLVDEFDPLPVQAAAFTQPAAETVFWIIASSAIPAGFGAAWLAGVLVGSFISAALRRELAVQSFETPSQTLRYLSGGALMGVGGVLAGGCTVGAGLSGGAALSVSALVTLAAIILGTWLMRTLLHAPNPSKQAIPAV